MDQVGTGTSIRVKCNFTDARHPNASPPYGKRNLSKKESTGSDGSTRAGSCHVRTTFASACHSRGKASNSNRQTALSCSDGANPAPTCPPEMRFKSCHALDLFYACVSSILLALASHTGTMAPLTATQQIATLPIQVPPKEHFPLYDIILTCIVYQGQA
jgi:hypothetical protein